MILTHHALRAVSVSEGGVRGVVLEDLLSAERSELACRVVVNAAGPWAGAVAAQAGLDVGIVLSRGALLVTRDRLVRGVLNRLRQPSDGDIVVPGGPVCLVGTTSVPVTSPDDLEPSADEVRKLIGLGGELVPALGAARIMREFAGIRPLYGEGGAAAGRKVSRGFAVLDHAARDGLEGFITVVGGKLTTYRLMAEQAADAAAAKLGVDAPCTTAERVLPGQRPADVLVARGHAPVDDPVARAAARQPGRRDGGRRSRRCRREPDLRLRVRAGIGDTVRRTAPLCPHARRPEAAHPPGDGAVPGIDVRAEGGRAPRGRDRPGPADRRPDARRVHSGRGMPACCPW